MLWLHYQTASHYCLVAFLVDRAGWRIRHILPPPRPPIQGQHYDDDDEGRMMMLVMAMMMMMIMMMTLMIPSLSFFRSLSVSLSVSVSLYSPSCYGESRMKRSELYVSFRGLDLGNGFVKGWLYVGKRTSPSGWYSNGCCN